MRKLTTKQWIEKARKVHGDRYDYSKVEYKGADEKVCIICHEKDENGIEHGEFWQRAANHITLKRGCPKCNGGVSISKEEFIKRASKLHNNKYNYSKSNYINTKTKIEIICPKHGSFWQEPENHMQGSGCPECGKETVVKKLSSNTEEFIRKAKLVHGNKYNYSKVNYINNENKVEIICLTHGSFWQKPTNHLSGCGCAKCGGSAKSNTKEFIEKANKIHNNKYNYSKVDYINSKTPITIICHKHGEFKQTPLHHLHGEGCPICAREKLSDLQRKTTKEFITEAKKVHNNKYDYSKVEYINGKTKVCIVCPKHGEYWQLPYVHTSGCGCSKCYLKSQTKLYEKLKESFPNEKILFEVNSEVVFWLKNQRFDIYFPKYNIAVEYNGKQHYVPINLFGGKLGFEDNLWRDELKRKKCKENNCTLFEVKYDYTEEDYQKLVENIQSIMNNYDTSKEKQ